MAALPAPAQPPPAAQAKVALNANNYQNALKLSLGAATSAFSHAQLGFFLADGMIGLPVNLMPFFPCAVSGTQSMELTDRNGNGALEPNDTVHIRWSQCDSGYSTLDGLMRVEVNEATRLTDGRDLVLTITAVQLKITPHAPGASTITLNFICPLHVVHTATSYHYTMAGGVFRSGQDLGADGLETVFVDYLQDYNTNTYTYSISGTVDSDVLGGEYDFSTPVTFSGAIGEFPTLGRLALVGGASSTAKLAKEGAGAVNPGTVLVSVDANGDGAAEAEVPDLAWESIVPKPFFNSFRDQIGATITGP